MKKSLISIIIVILALMIFSPLAMAVGPKSLRDISIYQQYLPGGEPSDDHPWDDLAYSRPHFDARWYDKTTDFSNMILELALSVRFHSIFNWNIFVFENETRDLSSTIVRR